MKYELDIIKRNFFRILRSGALNEFESLEPMSAYKWNKLTSLVMAQGVEDIAQKGLRNHTFDAQANFPRTLIDELNAGETTATLQNKTYAPHLSNRLLNRRLRKIQQGERHQIDASMTTLDLLNIIVANVNQILNRGISLSLIAELGSFLRTRGGKVDFVKLENWLQQLHIQRMAQLQGSILISVFEFEKEEIPFVNNVEPQAYALILRTLNHTANDTTEEWHFRQSRTGFVQNNSRIMRRNLRRSIRYINYAPIETISNFFGNFARSLSEIEE